MLVIDARGRTPIYEQLVSGIKKMIMVGAYAPGEALPSVRQLAADLGINANTIQKAYQVLESQGVVVTLPARGSFVAQSAEALMMQKKQSILKEMRALAREAWAMGISEEEATGQIRSAFEKEGKR